QEHMTSQIATAIEEILSPRGVAVMIEAEHMCMSLRGVEKPGSSTITTQFTGSLRDKPHHQGRLITMVPGTERLAPAAAPGLAPRPKVMPARAGHRSRASARYNAPPPCRAIAGSHARAADGNFGFLREAFLVRRTFTLRPTRFDRRDRGGPRLRAKIRRRWTYRLRCDRRAIGRGVDGRPHERAGVATDDRDRGSLVFQPQPSSPLAQRRNLWPCAARGRDAHRLRPGRGVDQG